MQVKYPGITVQLSGKDGNAYAVMGAVADAIRRVHGPQEANAYVREAREQESYDALLQHAMRTVEVQ